MKIIIPIKALSVNKAFQGRRFKTKEHKQYCQDVAVLLPKNERVHGFVDVHYKFFLVNWQRTDGGNLEKCLTDILVTAGIIDDDRYIMKYTIEKFAALEDRIEVEILNAVM
jgi:Holliday junction resolvase RusA-like endonuclease